MSFASKIILGFLIVAALVFLYLAMFTLDLRGWQKVADARQKSLETTEAQNALLRNSADANAQSALALLEALPPEIPAGRKQLRFDLSNRMIDRGRMWIGTAVPAANAPGAPLIFTVQPNPAQPTPLNLAAKTSLYLFEFPPVAADAAANASAGQYLGEFVVLEQPPVDAAAGKFAMAPAKSMSPREQTRLATAMQSGLPWLAYENLPRDGEKAFAGMTAEQIEAQFPGVFTPEQKDEFVLNGQDWIQGKHADDRKDSRNKYRRPLVDYGQLLQTLYRWRSELSAELASLDKDLSLMTAANADVTQQITYRKDEIVTLTAELDRLNAETKLVQDHLAALDAKLASVRAASKRIEADNRQLVARLASLQREAVNAAQTETASATP